MKTTCLVSLAALFTIAGCASKAGDPEPFEVGTLGTSEAQLVEDDSEAAETDDDLEVGLDEPLSGAAPADPGSPADGEDGMEKVRTNPGLFFRPAGCITTTIQANVATHVFANCTGPYGMTTFNGTVTSTHVREAGKLTITHAATDFQINGAKITGSRIVTYTRGGSVVTRVRTGNWTGTTAKGKAISHEANFTSSYDVAARCFTREGSATTSVGGRSLSRTLDNYKRCGIGRLGCPQSGLLTITGSNAEGSASLSIEFLGGRDIVVTRPNGTKVNRTLVCNPNAM